MALAPTSSFGGGGSSSSGALTLLSTTTNGSSSTIDVTGISAAYNDLLLVAIVRNAGALATDSNLQLVLNNDSAANYGYSYVTHSSAPTPTAAEGDSANSILMGAYPGNSATAGAFSSFHITIAGYASTTWWKSCVFQSGWATNILSNTHNTTVGQGLWNQTTAISRVTLSGSSGATLLTGSTLRIYGRL